MTDESIAYARSCLENLSDLKGSLRELKDVLELDTMKDENFKRYLYGTTGGAALEGKLKNYAKQFEELIDGYDKLVSRTEAFLAEQEKINAKEPD